MFVKQLKHFFRKSDRLLGKSRERLLAGGAERLGFDALLQGLQAAGLLRQRGTQRLDSTHVLGAVAKMGRLEVARETLRVVLRQLQRVGAHSRLGTWAVFHERYVDSQIAWHRLSHDGLKEKFQQAGRDALELITWLPRAARRPAQQ